MAYPSFSKWRRFTWVTPELGIGGLFRLDFSAGGIAAEGKEGAVYFNIDDVRVANYPNPAVDATSLGRVKALFR